MFGHRIAFNFDQRGDAHKTLLGGIFSIFIKVTIVIYVTLNLKKMILREDNKLITQFSLTNLDELGEVKYHETGTRVFYEMLKQLGGDEPLFLSDETSRYITITFN